MEFFGFDDTKLERFRGKPLHFFTKCSSATWIIFAIITIVFIVTVMVLEATKYQQISSSSLELIEQDAYHYNITHALPLRYVHWFWLAQLLPKVRNYQANTEGDENVF